jgi:hypothetical protein
MPEVSQSGYSADRQASSSMAAHWNGIGADLLMPRFDDRGQTPTEFFIASFSRPEQVLAVQKMTPPTSPF